MTHRVISSLDETPAPVKDGLAGMLQQVPVAGALFKFPEYLKLWILNDAQSRKHLLTADARRALEEYERASMAEQRAYHRLLRAYQEHRAVKKAHRTGLL